MAHAASSGNCGPAKGPPETSPWEWIVAAIGAALVTAAITYLIYFAESTPPGPPLITLEQGAVLPHGDGYLLPVTVTNEGATTAAAVEIEGRLSRAGAEPETASATLDYVPRFSSRQAGLYFANDPRRAVFELRALGYAEP